MSQSCYNCQRRNIGCHSTCKDYADATAENAARKQASKRMKDADSFLVEFHIKSEKKAHRRTKS